jgi:hypothetical protein
MSFAPKDPLLTAAKVLTTIVKILLGIVCTGLLVAIPLFLINSAKIGEALADKSANLSTVMASIVALLIVGALVVGAAFWFFQLLGKLIDTVGLGDPFVIENAARLEKMGWIAVAFQVAAIPLTMAVVYLRTQFPSEDIQIDADFSLTGILLALVLFILARVFRHGAAMREDLEGTV